jgi:RNA polymerase sigma factor for flagellar operon FliA
MLLFIRVVKGGRQMELNIQQKAATFKKAQKKQAGPYDALIEQYLPFASSIASKVARAMPADVDYDDIVCNARLGLLEAARRFDARFNVDFKTFAYYRIKGAIYDGLRKTGWMPRSLYTKMKFEQEANDCLKSLTEKIVEGTEAVKSDVDGLYDTVTSLTSMYVMSLDSMEDFEVEDKQAKKDIEHKAEFQKVKEKMRDAIEALPDKERKLIKMYYFQNRTLQEIGVRLSLSKSWTSRLHARALEILFKKLTSITGKPLKGEGDMPLGEVASTLSAEAFAEMMKGV